MNGQFSKPSAPVALWWAGLASLAVHGMLILLPHVVPVAPMPGNRPGPQALATTRQLLQVHLSAAREGHAVTTAQVLAEAASTPDPVVDAVLAAGVAPDPVSVLEPEPRPRSGSGAGPDSGGAPTDASAEPSSGPSAEPSAEPSHTPVSSPGALAEQGALPASAVQFYPVEQLDQKPRLLETRELDDAEVQSIVASGLLRLRLWIGVTGRVVEVEVEHSDLPEMLVRSAVTAFTGMRFVPGQRAGQVVGSVLRIEVRYDDGRQPPAAEGLGQPQP